MRKKIYVSIIIVAILLFSSWWLVSDLANKSFILCYHNVAQYKYGLRSLYISPSVFEKRMHFLKKQGYKSLPLKELVKLISNKKVLPKKTFAITFDDGSQNCYLYAYPILNKYGFTATVFIVINEIDKTVTYPRSAPEKHLSLEEINNLNKFWDIESHSLSHQDLTKISADELDLELEMSRDKLKNLTKKEVVLFCYPYGEYNLQIRNRVEKVGYRGACTTKPGLVNIHSDLYALPRIEWKEVKAMSLRDLWNLKMFYLKILLGV